MSQPWHRRHGCARGAKGRGLVLAFALSLAAFAPPAFASAQPVTASQASQSAIAAAIKSAAGGKVKSFYRDRNYAPLWVRGGTIGPEADRLVALLESADLDGLDPRDYDPDDLAEAIEEARGGSAKALAKAEVRLSRTFGLYVRDLSGLPAAKMTYVDAELQPQRPNEVKALSIAAAAPSFGTYIEKMGWVSPFYANLRDALADYREQWAGLPRLSMPTGEKLRPGSKGDRVRLLRQRLGLLPGTGFDQALAERVKAFQTAHGLPADGIVGDRTVQALNSDPDFFERKIKLNLVRARALPATQDRHIVVDAAGARLWMFEEGRVKDTMLVVVGRATDPTPMMAGNIRYTVVNPYWNIPPDLVAERIAPQALEGVSLADKGYEALSDWSANARRLSQDEVDWRAVAEGRVQLRVRQLPGKSNAMGRMKFMFPNDFGVYLHDTPDKGLFGEEDRRFSAGCVRVQDAPRLARWLYGKPLKVASGEPEQQVMLPAPVPVYITYLTAAPTPTGIAFQNDPYGRDAQAMRLARR